MYPHEFRRATDEASKLAAAQDAEAALMAAAGETGDEAFERLKALAMEGACVGCGAVVVWGCWGARAGWGAVWGAGSAGGHCAEDNRHPAGTALSLPACCLPAHLPAPRPLPAVVRKEVGVSNPALAKATRAAAAGNGAVASPEEAKVCGGG